MAHRRLLLEDLNDQHLTWLKGALDCAKDVRLQDWLQGIVEGTLKVFEVPGGIVGLRNWRGKAFVEFLAGKDMIPAARDVLEAVKEVADDDSLEGFVVHPGLERFYRRLGFKRLGTYVQLDLKELEDERRRK